MAAKSKLEIDVRSWLYKVIDSCINDIQLESATKLIMLYDKKYHTNTRLLYDLLTYRYSKSIKLLHFKLGYDN